MSVRSSFAELLLPTLKAVLWREHLREILTLSGYDKYYIEGYLDGLRAKEDIANEQRR